MATKAELKSMAAKCNDLAGAARIMGDEGVASIAYGWVTGFLVAYRAAVAAEAAAAAAKAKK